MDQNLSGQNPEYPALLSEVSMQLTQAGVQMEAPVFSITGGRWLKYWLKPWQIMASKLDRWNTILSLIWPNGP